MYAKQQPAKAKKDELLRLNCARKINANAKIRQMHCIQTGYGRFKIPCRWLERRVGRANSFIHVAVVPVYRYYYLSVREGDGIINLVIYAK